MKIFLDIGAHTGETVQVVKESRWGFDRIVSFEPAPSCWSRLEAAGTDKTELCRFGLWREDAIMVLNNAGQVGASLSADKDGSAATAECEFRDAGTWFQANLSESDEVYAKINVEGAEAELVQRLAETRSLALIDHLLIHFDVRKIPSKRHLEGRVMDLLDAAGVEYVSADEIQFGGVYRGTCNWLAWCHSGSRFRDLRYRRVSKLVGAARRRAYPVKRLLLRT